MGVITFDAIIGWSRWSMCIGLIMRIVCYIYCLFVFNNRVNNIYLTVSHINNFLYTVSFDATPVDNLTRMDIIQVLLQRLDMPT